MSQASAAQPLPAVTGGAVPISTEHAAVLDALCEGLRLVARQDPAMQHRLPAIARGLRALGAIAQSNAGAPDDAPEDAWQARLHRLYGVAHLLMLEKRGADFRQGLLCNLDAQNRLISVVYDDSGTPPCMLDFTVVRAGAGWVLRQRAAKQPVELVLGDVPDLIWAPAPPEEQPEPAGGGLSSFLANLTAKLPPEKTATAPPAATPDAGQIEAETPPRDAPAATASAGIAWYYAHENRQCGPVDEQVLRGLFLDGTLTEETLLWHKALDGWQPARAVAPDFINTPAPPPLPAEEPPPLPAEEPPPLPAEEPPLDWYYARQGQQQGPVADAEIRRLFAAGDMPPDTLVWNKTLTGWQPAADAGLLPAAPAARCCDKCGRPLKPGSRYCGKCGNSLAG